MQNHGRNPSEKLMAKKDEPAITFNDEPAITFDDEPAITFDDEPAITFNLKSTSNHLKADHTLDRKGTSKPRSTTRNLMDNLKRIEILYLKALIPEMLILEIPAKELQKTIEYLENLKKLVRLQQIEANQLAQSDMEEKSKKLMQRIDGDIALYLQFTHQSDLTLDKILKSSMKEIESDSSDDGKTNEIDGKFQSGPSVLYQSNASSPLDSLRTVSLHFSANTIRTSGSIRSPHESARQSTNLLFSIPPSPSGVFKWTVLRGLSNSLQSLESKFGKPTCFIVKYNRMLFGMEKGVILVYDLSQNLLRILEPIKIGKENGSVTAIDCSSNAAFIISGFSTGEVIIWDGQYFKQYKHIEAVNLVRAKSGIDGHLERCPILWVSAYSNTIFYTADASGSAFSHSFSNRFIYTAFNSVRIHGKANGVTAKSLFTTIHSISPLLKGGIRTFTDSFQLVALTTPFKIAIFSMKPFPQIQYRTSWEQLNQTEISVNFKESCAELSWWIPQSQSENINLRYLAFSHGSHLFILSISSAVSTTDPMRRKLSFAISAHICAPSSILAITWINSSYILCSIAGNVFNIYNSSTLSLIEEASLSPRSLLPNPPTEHPFFTRANMNRERSIHHSIISYRNRIFILSDQEVSFASLLSWEDRLSILLKAGKIKEALEKGVDIYNGKHTIVALKIPAYSQRNLVSSRLETTMYNLLSMTLSGFESERNEVDFISYKSMLEIIFEISLEIDSCDFLETQVWKLFDRPGLKNIFLNVLVEFILQENITKIQNQVIFDELLSTAINDPETLQQVILHLNPLSMDAAKTISVCEKLNLTNAMIYLYNQASADYVTPFLKILQNVAIDQRSEISKQNRFTLFVYLAHISCGKAFPFGLLNEKECAIASKSLFSVLFSPKQILKHETHEKVDIGKEPWPYFLFLLQADCGEMIKVLGTIFLSPQLDVGIQFLDQNSERTQKDPLVITRQYIIGILLYWIKLKLCPQAEEDALCCFICKSYRHFSSHLMISFDNLLELFNLLLDSTVQETKQDRQFSIQCLFETGFSPPKFDSDETLYILKFEKAGFWSLYEKMVIAKNDYDLAIKSYLMDINRKHDIFASIKSWMENVECREKVRNSVVKVLSDLAFDGLQLSLLCNQFWPNDHIFFLKELTSKSEKYSYLDGLLGPAKHLTSLDLSTIIPVIIPQKIDLYDHYIRLMFSECPKHVSAYLDYCSKAYTTLPVSLAIIEELAREFNNTDVKIWTFVYQKKFIDAILLQISTLDLNQDESKIVDSLETTLKICKMSPKSNIDPWFILLERVYFKICKNQNIWKSGISVIMKHVSTPQILHKLIESEEATPLNQIYPLLSFLFRAVDNEATSLEQTLKLSESNIFEEFKRFSTSLKSSYYPSFGQCQFCRNFLHLKAMTLAEQKSDLVIFKCHHSFHVKCLGDVLEMAYLKMKIPGLVEDFELWCPICGSPSDKKRKGKQLQTYTSMTDLTNGIGESSRSLVNKLRFIDQHIYSRKDMIQCFKDLSVKEKKHTHDEIFLNESTIDEYL